MIDGLSIDINSLPADQRANFGLPLHTIARVQTNRGGVAFWLMASGTGRIFRPWPSVTDGTGPLVLWGGMDGCKRQNLGFLGALVCRFCCRVYMILHLRKKACGDKKMPTALEEDCTGLFYPVVGILVWGLFYDGSMLEAIMGGIQNTGLNNALEGIGTVQVKKGVLGISSPGGMDGHRYGGGPFT